MQKNRPWRVTNTLMVTCQPNANLLKLSIMERKIYK